MALFMVGPRNTRNMRFDKYDKKGDYHWREYEDPTTKTYKHVQIIKDWIKEKNVLDIGAGDGLITGLMGFTGIDNEPTGVKLANEHEANVILGSAYELPWDDGTFSAALFGDTLEHLEEPEKALREAYRVLEDYLYVVNPIKRARLEKRHVQEWTPTELTALIESYGFKLEGPITVYPHDRREYAKFKKI